MLKWMEFKGVGPAAEMRIEYGPRLNFLTGDNGLGKSFFLDAAWWALTRTWAREPLLPHDRANATISYSYDAKTVPDAQHESVFESASEQWPLRRGRPPIPGLVLYAQVDGGFSVWDPARNYWKGDQPDRAAAYLFKPQEVWDGLPLDEPIKFCNGLLTDWATWQLENGEDFARLKRVLKVLSPSDGEPLQPGRLTKISIHDARRYPTLLTPYGQEVPLVHASAGIRRVLALAYLLVWAWQEHVENAKLRVEPPTHSIVFLIDEVEAHLHPAWQRRIVPALLEVMSALTGENDIPVQLITATHSPLVLASVEPYFDEAQDALWKLDLVDGEVKLEKDAWVKRGDADRWLRSDVFDLPRSTSREAEDAIGRAAELLAQENPAPEELEEADKALNRLLPEMDPLFVRWRHYVAEKLP